MQKALVMHRLEKFCHSGSSKHVALTGPEEIRQKTSELLVIKVAPMFEVTAKCAFPQVCQEKIHPHKSKA